MGMSASQARLLSITSRKADVEFAAQQIGNSKTRLAANSEGITKKYSESLDKKKLVFLTGFQGSTAVYTNLTANLLTNYNENSTEAQRLLTTASGQVVVSSALKANYDSSVVAAQGTGKSGLPGFLKTYGLAATAADAEASGGTLKYNADKVAYYTNIFNAAASGNGCVSPDNDNLLSDSSWLYNELKNGNLYINKWNSESNSGEGGFDSVSWQSGETAIQEVSDSEGLDQVKAEYDADMAEINNKDKKFDLQLKTLDTEHSALQTEYDSVKKVIDKNIETSYKSFSA